MTKKNYRKPLGGFMKKFLLSLAIYVAFHTGQFRFFLAKA
jgi:hypothetical protein